MSKQICTLYLITNYMLQQAIFDHSTMLYSRKENFTIYKSKQRQTTVSDVFRYFRHLKNILPTYLITTYTNSK